jgi:hypothetical protein
MRGSALLVIGVKRTVASARHGRLTIYDDARYFPPDERPVQLASDLRQLIRDSTP